MAGGAYRSALAFDAATSEKCRLQFPMPTFIAPLTLKIQFAIAATTGNVQFRAQVEAITPLDALNVSTTVSFDTANSSGSISVPSTTFYLKEFSITLTNNDSLTAGDMVTLTIDRDVTVGSNASGDCFLLTARLEDAS